MISSSNTPRRPRLAAGTVALALSVAGGGLLGACGGSDGASAESWCDFVTESDDVNSLIESLGVDPEENRALLSQVESYVERLPEEAPAEIADDAKTVSDNTQLLIDAFVEADFDVLDVDLSFTADDTLTAQMDAATESLDDFSERECGRSFGDSGDDADAEDVAEDLADDLGDDESGLDVDSGLADDFDPAAGTIRDQVVAQFEALGLTSEEANCIADNLDVTDPALQNGDIQAIMALFEECDVDMARLGELGG